MPQEEFCRGLSKKSFSRSPRLIFTWMSMISILSLSHAQEARFVSFNGDTEINRAMLCSPDGKNVYAAGLHTIAVFKRGGNDTLEIIQLFNNDHLEVRGIFNVTDLAISPDGRYLYGLNENDQSALLFVRDGITGEIRLSEVIVDSGFGRRGSGIMPAFEQNAKLLMASDGRSLYRLSSGNGILAVFARDLDTGGLTRVQILRNGDAELGYFNIPYWIAASPDGRHIYAGGGNGTQILILSRNSNGRITYKNYFDIGPLEGGRWSSGSITVSPDGKIVYASSLFDDKLFIYNRQQDTGDLNLVQTIRSNAPRNLLISPNENHVYFQHYDQASYFAHYMREDSTGKLVKVDDYALEIDFYPKTPPTGLSMSSQGDAIYMLDGESRHFVIHRDTLTGKLELTQVFRNNVGGTDRLLPTNSVVASPDNRFLYVGAENAINIFTRDQTNGRLTLLETHPSKVQSGMIISPDGKHLYTITQWLHLLEVFVRDEQTGGVQWVEAHNDSTETGWVWPAAFSPDGRHLFVTDQKDLFIFTRDTATGQLQRTQKIRGADHQLGKIVAVAVSPEGTHFYASSSDPNYSYLRLATFVRDSASGNLSFLNKIEFSSLVANSDLVVSPDGCHIYMTMQASDVDKNTGEMIGIFSRELSTGALTFSGIFSYPDWFQSTALAIATNGIDVYATIDDLSWYSGMLAMLERSPETGELTIRKVFQSWRDGVYALAFPSNIALSSDEAYVYVTDQNGVATFATGRSTTSVARKNERLNTLPRSLKLEQNYPNPLSTLAASASNGTPVTIIRYEIPATKNPATRVELTIYNLQGQLVSTLVNESKAPGQYSVTWDGTNVHGKQAPSGIYFYCIKAGEHFFTRKLTIVR